MLNENAQENLAHTEPGAIPTSKQALSASWELYKQNWKSFTGLILFIYAGMLIPIIIGALLVGFFAVVFRAHLALLAIIGIPLALAAGIAIFIWALIRSIFVTASVTGCST